MCGIAGKLSISNISDNKDIVKNMCQKMIHRGPDAEGILELGNITLGHRRLSIIDLSENAKQPMSSFDDKYHITYNGEIYNFQEIKDNLIQKGYIFKSNSDTEVILYSYQEYGKDCLKLFNGMFAFAIWDSNEKILFIARDRFGKKPLFYHQNTNGDFTFASEISALKEDKNIDFKVSAKAVNCYLALGYILSPQTMYENVFQLEPAAYMFISNQGKIIEKGIYWDYLDTFRHTTTEKPIDIANNILSLLKASVKRRMISDVPVGAFLSGGIDSSSIVAIMKQIHTGDLHTFSVGFNQKSYNELPDADKVANWIGTKHHGLIVNAENNLDLLHNAIDAYDQIFADNSSVPMIEVSKLARQNVTVVLSGDGADEICAGYITYKADKYYQYAQYFPKPIRQILATNRKVRSNQKINWQYKMQQFFYGSLYDYKKAHYLWRIFFHPEERIMIMGEKYRELVYDTDPYIEFAKHYEKAKDLDKLHQHLFVDAKTWLTDDILVKVDRATMQSSIEARAPYLDIDLVTYMSSIPSNLKLNGLTTKYILKKALENTIPEFVINKKKSGFNAPINAWLNQDGNNEFQKFNKYVLQRKLNNEKLTF